MIPVEDETGSFQRKFPPSNIGIHSNHGYKPDVDGAAEIINQVRA